MTAGAIWEWELTESTGKKFCVEEENKSESLWKLWLSSFRRKTKPTKSSGQAAAQDHTNGWAEHPNGFTLLSLKYQHKALEEIEVLVL